MKRILVACEESQAVTIEFRKLGFEAYSCDLLECSGGHPEWHFQRDVLEVMGHPLDNLWDLIIAFPPCTHLAVSGARHFEEKRKDGRQQEAIDFFMKFVSRPWKWAVENPIGIMSQLYRRPDQIIQPYRFGDPYQKSTCLWLNGLPKLKATHHEAPLFQEALNKGEFWEFESAKGEKKRFSKWYVDALKLSPDERAKARSKTFPGIAKAMAEQWGSYLLKNPQ